MQNILILGGSRFLGFYLSQELLRKGYCLTHFRRGETPPPEKFFSVIETIYGDRNHPESFKKIFQNKRVYDATFDFSGYNLSQVQPLVEEYSKSLGHYIFCSSSNVIAKPVPIPYSEEAPWVDAASKSGGEKLKVETLLLEMYRRHNFPITIFRPQGVLGVYDGAQVAKIMGYIYRKEPICVKENFLQAKTNLLDVRDLAFTFARALDHKIARGNIYNIANDEPISLQNLIHLCARISGLKVEIARSLAASPECSWWQDYDLVADTTKIKKDLSVEFTPLDQSVEQIIKWLQENRKKPWNRIKQLVNRLLSI